MKADKVRKPKCSVCGQKSDVVLRFPFNDQKRLLWSQAIKKKAPSKGNVRFKRNAYICDVHFDENDVVQTSVGTYKVKDASCLPLPYDEDASDAQPRDALKKQQTAETTTENDSSTEHSDGLKLMFKLDATESQKSVGSDSEKNVPSKAIAIQKTNSSLDLSRDDTTSTQSIFISPLKQSQVEETENDAQDELALQTPVQEEGKVTEEIEESTVQPLPDAVESVDERRHNVSADSGLAHTDEDAEDPESPTSSFSRRSSSSEGSTASSVNTGSDVTPIKRTRHGSILSTDSSKRSRSSPFVDHRTAANESGESTPEERHFISR